MTRRYYECEINTRSGPITFWAKAGGYLWVDVTGHGGGQACEGGHTNAGAAISVGGEYTDMSDDQFRGVCVRWWRARRRRHGAR